MAKPSLNPVEYLVLAAAVSALQGANGDAYYYDSDGAWIVDRLQGRYLTEHADGKVIYLIQPGDATYEADTGGCGRSSVSSSFVVAVAQRVGHPELPWKTGYEPLFLRQSRMLHDVYQSLSGRQLLDDVVAYVEGRELVTGLDGWCIVEVQVAYEFKEIKE